MPNENELYQMLTALYVMLSRELGEERAGKLWGEIGYPILIKAGWIQQVPIT